MKLYPHPTQPGWLIGTTEVERLLNAPHRLILPDGSEAHPLYSTPPDFDPDDIDAARAWAIDLVNSQPQPYTTPEYIEARRWQQQPDTALALDTGRLSAADFAAAVVSGYEAAQRTLKMRLSLLAQAKTIEEIETILGRL